MAPRSIRVFVQHDLLVGPVAKFLIEACDAENDEFYPMPPPPPGSGSTSWSSAKTQLPSIDINSINDPDISVLGLAYVIGST